MSKKKVLKFGTAFVAIFLFFFMILIFGPAEIYFTNTAEFQFVYGDFAYRMIGLSLGISLGLALVAAFLPMVLFRVCVSIFFGISVAGYIQIMFINSGLDLLGMNPDGYQIHVGQAFINVLIWLAVIGLMLYLAFKDKETWKLLVTYGSEILICIQAVAWCSLIFTASSDAFCRQETGQYFLSGKEQYTVSAQDNIIVILLDYFSNEYLEPTLEQYPDLLDDMKDFTYYDNADCVYYGTYPSLIHIMSGEEIQPQIGINNWCLNLWKEDHVKEFYQSLREQNYVSNFYTPDKNMLCGMNGVEILKGIFSNVANKGMDLVVDYEQLVQTMAKMSAYRMFPYILKPYVYTDYTEYAEIVTRRNDGIAHTNSAFYEGLLEHGLTLNEEANYYVVQHLEGTHALTTGSDGFYKEDATREETVKGCMVMLEEYFSQLKSLGVYDDATIIVTSDHGGPRDSQIIFFMKNPGETHDEMQVNTAPISMCEYPATIAKAAGLDYTAYGTPVDEISQDTQRERTVWVRLFVPELPSVGKYSGTGVAAENAYCGFTYTGGIEELLQTYDDGADIVVQEVDSFY